MRQRARAAGAAAVVASSSACSAVFATVSAPSGSAWRLRSSTSLTASSAFSKGAPHPSSEHPAPPSTGASTGAAAIIAILLVV